MFLEMFTITGAIIGATITTFISPVLLYFFFAAFLCTSFLRIRHIRRGFIPSEKQDRVSSWLNLQGSYYDEATGETITYRANHALWGGGGMFIAGIAAGMLGIGAGAFKVTVHENILHLPPKVSSTTSNFIIGMTALAAVSVYLFSGLIESNTDGTDCRRDDNRGAIWGAECLTGLMTGYCRCYSSSL